MVFTGRNNSSSLDDMETNPFPKLAISPRTDSVAHVVRTPVKNSLKGVLPKSRSAPVPGRSNVKLYFSFEIHDLIRDEARCFSVIFDLRNLSFKLRTYCFQTNFALKVLHLFIRFLYEVPPRQIPRCFNVIGFRPGSTRPSAHHYVLRPKWSARMFKPFSRKRCDRRVGVVVEWPLEFRLVIADRHARRQQWHHHRLRAHVLSGAGFQQQLLCR